MPRPRKRRMVANHPRVVYFKPQGVPVRDLMEVVLPIEGLEALRLADLEGLEQAAAAARMGVSRPTFSRVLTAARRVVSQALVHGQAIRLEGGDYMVHPPDGRGPGPGQGRRGRGRGRGPGGFRP